MLRFPFAFFCDADLLKYSFLINERHPMENTKTLEFSNVTDIIYYNLANTLFSMPYFIFYIQFYNATKVPASRPYMPRYK